MFHYRMNMFGRSRATQAVCLSAAPLRRVFEWLVILTVISLLYRLANAQPDSERVFTVQPGSELWFDGSSTVNHFTCENHKVNGFGSLRSKSPRSNESSVSAVFYADVVCMSCGLAPMDQDMYKALKASEYPEIRYVLDKISFRRDTTLSDSLFYVETEGELTVAGRTNPIEMRVEVRALPGGRYIVQGSKTLSMHDYGIIPPTALWGLIKANDNLTVHFRLIAGPDLVSHRGANTYDVLAHSSSSSAGVNSSGQH